MAGVGFGANTPEISAGTSAVTILQIKAVANIRAKVQEWSVSFKGTSNTAGPVLVEIVRQTDAGTMTSLTLVKYNPEDDETLQVTAQHTATVEPTTTDVLFREEVHPQTGYTWQAPFGREIPVKGGTYLGIRITCPASVTVTARMIGEE